MSVSRGTLSILYGNKLNKDNILPITTDLINLLGHVKQMRKYFKSLTPLERKLTQRLDLLKVEGKRGRHVPLLILPKLKIAMKLLVSLRKKIGIKNDFYVFPNRGKSYIRAWVYLQEFAKETKVQNSSLITRTNLRK